MGADSLADFATWREPDAILAPRRAGGGARPGAPGAGGPRAGAWRAPAGRVVWLDNPGLDDLVERDARARARRAARCATWCRTRWPPTSRATGSTGRARELPARRSSGSSGSPSSSICAAPARPGCRWPTTAPATTLRRRRAGRARSRDAGVSTRAARAVLDVGCGTGFFTAYYLERGAPVYTGSTSRHVERRPPRARAIPRRASCSPT